MSNSERGIECQELSGPIRRILVATKYRFIGDTLLAIPLLRAVSQRWPDATVALMTGAKACELVKNSPYVHDVIEYDPYRASDKGVSCYIGLVSRLRRCRFDLVIVCNRSFHSALTAALAGARNRIGWSGFEKRDSMLTHTVPYDPGAPEVESYLDLVRCVSPSADFDPRVELWISPDERSAVRAKLPNGHLIGIQPGASHPEKQWPADRFAELAIGLLDSDPGSTVVLLGGPEEKAAADAMLAAIEPGIRNRLVSVVGEMSLRETLGALTFMELFVAGDTAIRHAAMALDRPSVALFGPTSVRKWGNADPPRHVALAARDGDLSSLSVDEVLSAAVAAWGEGRCNYEPQNGLGREVTV
jgi:lipopolysaccharide heptosyltransferase II